MRIEHVHFRVDQQGEIRTFIKDFFRNLTCIGTENVSRHRVEARRSLLREQWEKFSLNHDALTMAIAKLQDEERQQILQRSYYRRRHFESTREHYLEALERAHEIIERSTSTTRAPSATQSVNSGSERSAVNHHVPRLPPVDLPKFNGTVAGWLAFKDMFTSMVIANPNLDTVYKLHYLKNCLVGTAAHFINNTALSENNFEKAWESLQSFYENTRVLLNNAMQAAIAMKRMSRESAAELEQLYTSSTQVRQSIETLKRSMPGIDDFLIFLTTQRFDPETMKAWENHLGASKDPATWRRLSDFIFSRLLTLKSYEHSSHTKPAAAGPSNVKVHYTGQNLNHRDPKKPFRCNFCSQDHPTSRCPQYCNLTAVKRSELITKHHLCYNCLGNHRVISCPSHRRCDRCGKKHHTSIHQLYTRASPERHQITNGDTTNLRGAHVNHASSRQPSCILLATAKVCITSGHGERCNVRALIDQGSEISLISERVVQRLKLQRKSMLLPIVGIGAHSSASTRGVVKLQIQAHFNTATSLSLTAHILPKLTTALPSQQPASCSWPHLQGLQLADPEFCSSGAIDMLLGADIYGQILEEGVVKGGSDTPTAQLTKLGWIISGPSGPQAAPANCRVHHVKLDVDLHEALQRFWSLDEVPKSTRSKLSRDEEACEAHFLATHSRDDDGKYVVRLPFKAPASQLGDSRPKAFRMLCSLSKKFQHNPAFHRTYSEFIEEYEKLKHLARVQNSAPEPETAYYLPHHGVLKENSLTTKLRVVFNGSSVTSSGKSINDLLHSGANLQINLFDVLMYFRLSRYVFMADIEKFYRQIKVHPEDWKFQRILWYLDHQLVTYELTTVTYGTACASFLALRAFLQLLQDEGNRFPLALMALTRGRYVDDIAGGADSPEEARAQITQIIQICKAGGFPIQKWNSNHPEVLADVPEEQKLTSLIKNFGEPSLTHALGLGWKPTSDTFHFDLELTAEGPVTKRKVLSLIARIFDPLGLLSPVVIVAKHFVQELWATNLEWDDELAHEKSDQWRQYVNQLKHLSQLAVPRWLGTIAASPLEIHGFCDASQKAMAAAVYVRVSHADTVTCTLICSKTKVAPLKRLTIPRLELCGAVLLAKLLSNVIESNHWHDTPVFCWTDSSITYTWLNNQPSRWKEFVQNRVCYVQELLPRAQWRFVPGKINPADCATRGLDPSELLGHTLWWNGPSWLVQPSSQWPTEVQAEFSPEHLEERAVKVNMASHTSTNPLQRTLDRCSTLSRLIRCTATIQRAMACFKKSSGASLAQKPLTPGDMDQARAFWVKFTQGVSFRQEIKLLQAGQPIPRSSPLIRLTPHLDTMGILRLGGRLQNSKLSHEAKHPAILPRTSAFTTLVIRDAHHKTLHGGVQLTLAYIRNNYWILGGRAPVRSLLLKCVLCTRHRQQ